MNYDKCACKGNFLDKFIQPAILVALYDEPLHGFSLLKKMKDGGLISGGEPDPTGLYRTLKKMEAAGLLCSDVEVGESKKLRRIYTITADGRDCLVTWKSTLETYRADISGMIVRIEEKVPQDTAEKCICCCADKQEDKENEDR